jgi:hypothetical protein
MYRRRSDAERMADRTGPPNERGCREFIGLRLPTGYGRIWSRQHGRVVTASRLAWELAYGPIPDGVYVCHHCDNPPCCEPTHLFLGTPGDNSRDASAKGRLVRSDATIARLTETRGTEACRTAQGERMRRRWQDPTFRAKIEKPIEHGTHDGYVKEGMRGILHCAACRRAHAEYARELRGRGVTPEQFAARAVARAVARFQPIRHGTAGGKAAHLRRGSPCCVPCRIARRIHDRELY